MTPSNAFWAFSIRPKPAKQAPKAKRKLRNARSCTPSLGLCGAARISTSRNEFKAVCQSPRCALSTACPKRARGEEELSFSAALKWASALLRSLV
eukprot:Skav200148  [mRNA]  locus=scaffold2013:307246:311344:+ [translate_table: standard]